MAAQNLGDTLDKAKEAIAPVLRNVAVHAGVIRDAAGAKGADIAESAKDLADTAMEKTEKPRAIAEDVAVSLTKIPAEERKALAKNVLVVATTDTVLKFLPLPKKTLIKKVAKMSGAGEVVAGVGLLKLVPQTWRVAKSWRHAYKAEKAQRQVA